MEPTIHTAIIGGSQVEGVRELHAMTTVATFDAEHADAVIDPTTLHFVDAANDAVRALHAANPLEAPDFIPTTNGYGIVAQEKYAIDFRTLRLLSTVECEASVFRLSSVDFEKSAAGVSMQLLKDKGILLNSDFRNVPYVTENRKRALELAVLALQLIQIQKTIFDEIFKQVNIAGDILSGAAVVTIPAAIVAIANLIMSWFQIVLLVKKMIQLIKDNRELFMPPVRYHKGINWYTYLLRVTNYLGLSLQVGDELKWILQQLTLLPSKSDEVGIKTILPVNILDINLGTVPNLGDGLLRPSDFGYTGGQLFALTKRTFNCKSAVKDGVYHLRWRGDLFWQQAPNFVIPDVKIEQALGGSNGYTEYNYSDMRNRELISYAKDQTDKHTLTDVNNRMSELIYDHPVSEKRRSLLKGSEMLSDIEIPYALCVRKPVFDGVYSGPFSSIVNLINTFQDELAGVNDNFPSLQQVGQSILEKFGIDNWIQEGALLVENHFFDQPKIVMQGANGRIPSNFTEHISADALYKKWHSFNCMAPGWKDPANPSATNQKIIFRQVEIPFGILDRAKTIVNSNCFVPGFGEGEFLSIAWTNGGDFAVCDFWAYHNWAPQLTAKLYKIAPNNIISFL